MPNPVIGRLRQLAYWVRAHIGLYASDYRSRVAAEESRYRECTDVHDLPPIFHYWSNRYLRPKLETFGFSDPDAFFAQYVIQCYRAAPERRRRFISIGSGNCDTEVRLARALVGAGCTDYTLECLDMNEAMLSRGCEFARSQGVGDRIVARRADFNRWSPDGIYDAVIANQSLHHVQALEHLFDAVHRALAPHARFVVSDIIGRNGHLRWPEARAIVEEFWRELPASYRYNRQLDRVENEFSDWDCSVAGFEGIRAQDILPLLVDRFSFDLFIGCANVIDPFIDRGFGPNFSVEREWDRNFIDRVHARDDAELASGRIKPTHMFAVMCIGREGENRYLGNFSPRNSIRWP